MTLIAYEKHRLSQAGQEIIDRANTILADLSEQGYTLTLRQLYYQFVSKNWLENTEKSYKRLGDVISKGRLSGQISWTAIEDRNRGLLSWGFDEDPASVIRAAQYSLMIDQWRRQPYHVEAWVEKDALINVVGKPCSRLQVPHMACKGYLSLSEGWKAGNRFREAMERGQKAVLLYLGDHDPSGIDMTRNHRERQNLFAGLEGVDVRRLALNMDQVEHYGPPPNPTKLSDSRASGYMAQFGDTCWELDALQPSVIDEMVTKEVEGLRDDDLWAEGLKDQGEKRALLKGVSDNWPLIERYLNRKSARS